MKRNKTMKNNNPMPRILCGLMPMLLLVGCAGPAVVFTTATQVGVEVNAADGGRQGARAGYDRFEGVIMPMAAPRTDKEPGPVLKQAYPVYSEYEFESGSLAPTTAALEGGIVVRQVFATGKAALTADVRRAVSREFAAMSAHIATDEASEKVQEWLATSGSVNEEKRRRTQIATWLKANQPGVRVHDFIYGRGNVELREQFLKGVNP